MSEVSDRAVLAVIPASAVSIIVGADEGDILGKLAQKVAAHKPDISTPKGRKEIASLAAEIASSKMDLIRLGKSLTEDWRKSTAAVNAECKVIEDRMDALKVQVRAPLTAFEEAEKARVDGHEAALSDLQEPSEFFQVDHASHDLQERLAWLRNLPPRDWQEFSDRAKATIAAEIADTERLLEKTLRREAYAAEHARLRAEAEERARQEAARVQAEREARIAAEAAEWAKREAEAEAERQRVAAEQKVAAAAKAAAAKAEAERQQVERAKVAAEERAAEAERRRVAAEAQAKADAEAASRKAEADRLAAEARAEREKAAAVAAEQKRVADARAAEEAETARRAADKAHRQAINNAARAALVTVGMDDALATAVVTAIARGQVPAVSIHY